MKKSFLKEVISPLFFVILLCGCKSKGKKQPEPVKEKVVIEATQDWSKPAHFTSENLKWEKGTGAFEGGEIAFLGTDKSKGYSCFFLKMPKKMMEEAHGGKLHLHKSTTHTYVLKGMVSAEIGGVKYTAKPGDYFRFPANIPHRGSEVMEDALMFVFSEGNEMGVDLVDEKTVIGLDYKIENQADHTKAGLFVSNALSWEDGKETFQGGKVSFLTQNKQSGLTVMRLNMPTKSLKEAHDGKEHSHTSTSHTLILSGSVSAYFNGKKVSAVTGDYFRMPAGLAHQGSEVPTLPGGCDMFIINEADFGTIVKQ